MAYTHGAHTKNSNLKLEIAHHHEVLIFMTTVFMEDPFVIIQQSSHSSNLQILNKY